MRAVSRTWPIERVHLAPQRTEIKEALGVAYLMGGLPAMVAGSNAFRNIQRG